ncbi:MAG TPA: hypothetical protein VMU24_02685 [Candidatus Acidoferrales bacterium]|nr:hypothetical protein [Candidatus Acidoferrales bacterium]
MREDRQIRDELKRLEAAFTPHGLPTSAEAWSRLQFRLAYRARREKSTPEASIFLAALYILAFLIHATWSGWVSAGLLAVVAAAFAAAGILFRCISRSFES